MSKEGIKEFVFYLELNILLWHVKLYLYTKLVYSYSRLPSSQCSADRLNALPSKVDSQEFAFFSKCYKTVTQQGLAHWSFW